MASVQAVKGATNRHVLKLQVVSCLQCGHMGLLLILATCGKPHIAVHAHSAWTICSAACMLYAGNDGWLAPSCMPCRSSSANGATDGLLQDQRQHQSHPSAYRAVETGDAVIDKADASLTK